MSMKNDGSDPSRWVSGEFSFWLIDFSENKPINLFLRNAESLHLRLEGDEWGELFYGVLECPTALKYEGERSIETDYQTWKIRYEQKFKEAIPDFPMLQELCDIFYKILFNKDQIHRLKSEVLEIIPKAANNEIALQGLEKLKTACEKALEKEKLLYFN